MITCWIVAYLMNNYYMHIQVVNYNNNGEVMDINCEGVRKGENILMLEYIKGVVWRSLDDGLGIMIGGDMNAHIWQLDGCENENGRRMKESINEMGLQVLNCVWDGLNEATWCIEENKFTLDYVCMDGRGLKKGVSASILLTLTRLFPQRCTISSEALFLILVRWNII